jgi:two-component system phosphate regulon sensor histidine kinase PhoR
MEWRIRRGLILMGLFSAILAFALALMAVYGMFVRQVEKDVQLTAQTVSIAYDDMDSIFDLSRYATEGLRITLIDPVGAVLYESGEDADAMVNQSELPEVRSALETGVGQSMRPAEDTDENKYYYAMRLRDGNILRVSMASSNMFSLFLKAYSGWAIFIISVVIVLSVAVATLITRRMVAPLKSLAAEIDTVDLSPRSGRVYRELLPFIRELRQNRREKDRLAAERLHMAELWRTYSMDISHELKTPLTSISGYAEIMKDGTVDPETGKRFSEAIYREAQRMRSLINDVLYQAKMESDVPDTLEQVDMLREARECADALSFEASARNVAVQVEGESWQLMADHEWIDSIYINLIANAIHYNVPNGSVQVRVYPSFVEVSDTGIGIPQEDIPHLFERFYRVDKSRSRETGGTGLGLPIVKTIADRYGATIRVDSAMGRGTTIRIDFPQP